MQFQFQQHPPYSVYTCLLVTPSCINCFHITVSFYSTSVLMQTSRERLRTILSKRNTIKSHQPREFTYFLTQLLNCVSPQPCLPWTFPHCTLFAQASPWGHPPSKYSTVYTSSLNYHLHPMTVLVNWLLPRQPPSVCLVCVCGNHSQSHVSYLQAISQ